MPEYRRYNITLRVVDPSARDKFRRLSRPESFFEIRPNRSAGQRGAYSVEMTQDEYEAALKDAANPESNLISVHPQYPRYSSAGVGGAPDQGALTYVAAQDAEANGLTGSGVLVGMLDSGLSTQLRDGIFAGRVVAAADKTGGDGVGGPYNDEMGHGSEMASLAVPAKAKLAIAKVNAQEGELTDADIASGIYWLVDEIHVRIINCSLGGAVGHGDVEADAVAHAVSKGVLFFAAAGNESAGEVNYPARWPGALAITNYNRTTDSKVSDSNYGQGVFAATGGAPVTWIQPGGATETANNGGTSAATAMATHIAALLATGGTSTGNVKKYLAETARKTGASPQYEGNGVLQLAAAYSKLKGINPPKTNPDGSIPLSGGAQVSPINANLPGGLPPKTTVYPTGDAAFGSGAVTLPDGGTATFPTDGSVPVPEDYNGGDFLLDAGSTLTPESGIDPAGEPGACDEPADGAALTEEPLAGYWVYIDEISAEVLSALTTSPNPWTRETDGVRPWITQAINQCQLWDRDINANEIAALEGAGWWRSGGTQLVRLCPPNSWYRTF